MIRLAESINQLEKYEKMDVFSVRILSLASAYGLKYAFATFWVQEIDSTITAIVSRLDRNVTISHCNDSHLDEINDFVTILGFTTLMCSDDLKINCPFETGFVMENKKISVVDRSNDIVIEQVPLEEVFKLNQDFLQGVDYNSFYADMSHKIRHGVVKTYGVKSHGKFVSCGALTSIYCDHGILSFVATAESFRCRGLASKIVVLIIGNMEKKCFLIRENGKNEDFYKKLGFINTEKWRMYKNDTLL